MESVDTIKLVAITCVIAIHTVPFKSGSEQLDTLSPSVLINQLCRFAVPYFFVVSGYFWGARINNGADVWATSMLMAKRIAYVFVIWSAIYLAPYNISSVLEYGLLGPIKVAYWNVISLPRNPLDLILAGTKVHLWFLPSLLCSLLISALFVLRGRVGALISCTIVLYVVGLLAKSYVDTPVGIRIAFNTRNGPFFGSIFFVTGYVLSRLTPNAKWLWKGTFLAILGCALQFTELSLLHSWYRTNLWQDYLIGTYFMGVGFALIALSNPEFLRAKSLHATGRLVFGVYAIHFVFVENLHSIGQFTSSAWWQLGYVLSVLLLSIATVLLMSNVRFLRQIVS